MPTFSVEELRVHFERLLQLERADPDQVLRVDLAVLAPKDGRVRVDLPQPFLNDGQLSLFDEVDFVEEDAVGERDLGAG